MPAALPRPAPAAPPAAHWQQLLQERRDAQQRTDQLFGLIPAERLFERPIAERHRLAFYLGHLEAFDVNLLLHAGQPHSGERLDRLFAFGIDPIDGQLPRDRPEDWPGADCIRSYAQCTRARVDEWLEQLGSGAADAAAVTRLQAAIEHRWMHAETLGYLLNRLPGPRPLRPALAASAQAPQAGAAVVEIPAGMVQLGQRRGFGWDNEFPAHRCFVPGFLIDRTMVSNGQFLQFVQAGGYHEARYWSEPDWHWRTTNAIEHPAAWLRGQDAWYLASRVDRIAFQSDWPVYVSHAEACAYARWSGRHLPSEAQWQRAAYADGAGEPPYPWGDARADASRGNFDFARWDPVPVHAHPAGASAFGVQGLIGNGWEWTRTPFEPFAGFQAAAFYPGYSADFFDARHYVLKGGSAHTALRLLRPSFRNWFQPHYPYVFAGFRCVSELS